MDASADAQASPFAELIDTLIKGWADLTASAPKGPGEAKAQAAPQRAYLLLNRWEDNPLARDLNARFPKWARDRVTVPDSYFEHRPERAPCLLELPEELTDAALGIQTRPTRDWLAHCLMQASHQAKSRTSRHDFCGVVIGRATAQAIVQHWVGLGNQRPPYETDSVLFRYHDPRVMQRVWPTLSPLQQSRWLGPVSQWWSLLQPWGPFNAPSEPARWFHAKAPLLADDTPGEPPSDLLNPRQWLLSGISPQANHIWRDYAESGIAPDAQPDARVMVEMLVDAQRLGFDDLSQRDYVWTTWMHTPKEGPARAMDWSLPHLAPILGRIEAQLRERPGDRFSTLLNQIIQSQR
ncbi:MAG: DUF4123 domain-containing protein [Variovorax sp.]|nr:DUF4123 domain-containing protein [Variovorax sp.]